MRSKRCLSVAALAAGMLVLSACGTAGGGGTAADETGEAAPSITVAISQTPDAYNGNTANTNSVYNSYVDNLVHSNFALVNNEGVVEPNTDFGTYEKTSDDPLTVRYTFAEDAVWSDGTPIDYDDFLLAWAAQSNNNPAPEPDENGNDVDIFQPASSNGWRQTAMPEGSPGDKTVELVYEEPYADWEALLANYAFMPAHVAAEQAGLSAENNGEALVAAIEERDTAALTAVAGFWNSGWNYEADLPRLPDASLIPSSGPYKLDNASNGTLTLVRNERYWGEELAGQTESIIFRTVDDTEAVQALQNGDVDVISPSSPSVDTKAALEQIGDTVRILTGTQMTFSHIDLDQRPEGVFADQRVREAFSMCVPRQDMVDKFVKPIDPEGVVQNLREYQPPHPDYDAVLADAPSASKYDEVDLEGARAKLAEAGRTEPVTVRLMFAQQSKLRADLSALVKDSCDQAGFNIELLPDPEWTDKLTEVGAWDAIMFAWAGSGLVASGQSIYITNGEQNFGGYSDPEVDELWNEIATTTDTTSVVDMKARLEERLASTVYNVVLYSNPGLDAHSSRVEGVVSNATQYGITWNAYDWVKRTN
jgi:peptide/nickel transport system substrate-binding protein